MKKLLLALLIGMVLAMNLYGIVKEFVIDREIDHIEETTITVYME